MKGEILDSFCRIGKESLLYQEKRPAPDIARQCVFSRDGIKLLGDSTNPVEWVERLLERQLWHDLLPLLAQMLPERHAVWWGCLCVWHKSEQHGMATFDKQLLESAVRWVLAPTEENRSVALRHKTIDALDRPAGRVAGAIEYTVGGISKNPAFVGHLVGAAVLGLSGPRDPSAGPKFVELAIRIGNHEIPWPTATN